MLIVNIHKLLLSICEILFDISNEDIGKCCFSTGTESKHFDKWL